MCPIFTSNVSRISVTLLKNSEILLLKSRNFSRNDSRKVQKVKKKKKSGRMAAEFDPTISRLEGECANHCITQYLF